MLKPITLSAEAVHLGMLIRGTVKHSVLSSNNENNAN